MNHIYRSIWSEALGAWIAVSENSKGKAKSASKSNKLLATGLLLCSASVCALPTGEELVAGQANVSTPTAGQMQINQSSQNAIINWNGFSIAPGEAVNIQQPNINAALLNRVIGADASVIQGQLSANGQVYLINPNGVLFSNTAQVDVGGLIASTHNISNTDFLTGNFHFTQDNTAGIVSNQGHIKVPDGGMVALIGTQVSNTGIIETPKGTTALAAGKTVDLDFQGNGLVEVKIPEAALNAQIENKGAILAEGGRVVLTAKAAGDLMNTVINQEGIIKAKSLVERNGEIILDGGDNGITQVSGSLDTSGNNAGEKGGKIVVTGDKVLIAGTAKLDATGKTGGGDVLVGGSWQNTDSSIRQATATIVEKGAVLDASATDNGKGGTVVAWSDIHNQNSATRAYGTFLAKGGINGGAGGRIETSGHWLDTADIMVNASAIKGLSGTWLLDPYDITIDNCTGCPSGWSGGNPDIFTPLGTSSVSATTITSSLNSGTSVIVNTGTAGANPGNISVNAPITATSSAATSLTLDAANSIFMNNLITLSGSNTAIILKAGGAIVDGNGSATNIITNKLDITAGAGMSLDMDVSQLKTVNTSTINGSALTNSGSAPLSILSLSDTSVGTGISGIQLSSAGSISIDGSVTANGLTLNSPGIISAPTLSSTVNINGIFTLASGTWDQINTTLPSFYAKDFRLNAGSTFIRALGGTGASGSPYQIADVYGLQGMGSTGMLSNNYTLANNIDAVGTSAWNSGAGFAPVGDAATPFAGKFDGLGQTISNLTINRPTTDDVGLFGRTTNLSSVALSNIGLVGGSIKGQNNVGGLVGYLTIGNVNNAYATGDVTGLGSVGGLIGFCNYGCTINNSYATGTVSGSSSVGGLAGNSYNSISNSYATGIVNGTDIVGGLVGYNAGIISNNSHATGDVSGVSQVGGLVGNHSTAGSGIITDSYATGNVSSTVVGGSIGGLVGSSTAQIVNSYATGNVTAINSDLVGGLVGYNASTINNAYATGIVMGANNVGGLVGWSLNSIDNAYATGNVKGDGTGDIAGLVGYNSGSISSSYAMGNVDNGYRVGGLVGLNDTGSIISNAYATGNVSGSTYKIGGLIGLNYGTISNAYAIGNVNGLGATYVGGFIGYNSGAINNSFWDTQTTTQSNADGINNSPGATGKTTIEMQQLATFTGWNIANTGGSSAVWRIYEGNTAPLLRSFLTSYTLGSAPEVSLTYNGASQNGANFTNITGVLGTPASGKNVGFYNGGYYSSQQYYDLIGGNLLITPANLVISTSDITKIYDGTTIASGNAVAVTPTSLFGTDSLSGGTFAFTDKNAGIGNKSVTVAAVTVNDGNLGNNYTVSYQNNSTSTISPATLTYIANLATRLYGEANPAFTGTLTGFVNGESLETATTGIASFTSLADFLSNIGNYAIDGSGLSANFGNYTFTQAAGNATALTITPVAAPPVVTPVANPVVTPVVTPVITPVEIERTPNLQEQLVQLQTSTSTTVPPNSREIPKETTPTNNITFLLDVTNEFAGNSTDLPDLPCNNSTGNCDNKLIQPTLSIKNSAGRVERLQLSANKQFLSLLLEDGTVRVWDFENGVQRLIVTKNNKALSEISSVNDQGELVSIAGKTGIGTYDVISSTTDDKSTIKKTDVNSFATSSDGFQLLANAGATELSLWDTKQNLNLWQLQHKRGVVKSLALTKNKRYGAVLSSQPGSYALPPDLDLKRLTDAVDIVDLAAGKIIKSLPNMGDHVVYMQFKDNDTLQIGLANGEVFDWSIATGEKKTAARFAEAVTAVDANGETYSYILKDGTVRVSDGQGQILLSVQNKENPFEHAKLLEGGKKLLTVMASGDVSVWDLASGKKMLRLFSSQQNGWTVMDSFGRFDGSEEAIENFSWLAKEDDIPLDSFSENYYEPGLLASVLQNKTYLNDNPNMIRGGISLPPKLNLQLAEQQASGDKVALQLDVYDRGGGINKVNFYHNDRLLSNEDVQVSQSSPEHRVLSLNITPNAGKNTLKVVATNDMGIENSSSELNFDGKTKAYTPAIRLLTVGINQYSDANLNLDYSVADARAIGDAIKSHAKITASKSLTNEEATKPRILAELKELSRGEQHEALVIYLAGHGMVAGKEWYFLPYETRLQPTVEKIVESGISATELADVFKNSKIQHILLMVDACHSGASTAAFTTLQNGQRYFTRQLSRSLGITVVTATTKDQEAAELKKLGHGLFTYLMTQELQNKTGSESVTAHSISRNITKTLPAFSQKMLGVSQDPAVYTHGNDFMLTDVVKEASATVPKKPPQ